MNSAPKRQRRFRSVSLFWLIPNIITVAGLISGLTALRFALDGRWSMVIGLITLAAVFDALDGRAARRFKTSSLFGAALDSLSDMVVFGVVPALCLYLWALQDSGNLAWWATMFYAVAIALRLARFDSELRDPPEQSKDFFTGVPAPAAAFLVLTPICVDLELGIDWARESAYVGAWLVVIGGLAVSSVPTFAGKRIKLPAGTVLPVLAAGSILIAGIFMQPWITYLVLATVYVATIPLAIVKFSRDRASSNQS